MSTTSKILSSLTPEFRFPRVYLKTENVTGSEEFSCCARHFFRRNTDVFQGKMTPHSAKRTAVRARWQLEEYTLRMQSKNGSHRISHSAAAHLLSPSPKGPLLVEGAVSQRLTGGRISAAADRLPLRGSWREAPERGPANVLKKKRQCKSTCALISQCCFNFRGYFDVLTPGFLPDSTGFPAETPRHSAQPLHGPHRKHAKIPPSSAVRAQPCPSAPCWKR